jgi:DNA polymerase III gamma/tau subunit
LSHVALKEGFSLSKESADLIARHGKSSYRDALGYLEQVLRLSQKEVDHEHVVQFMGVGDESQMFSLLKAFCTKDASAIVESVESLREKKTQAVRVYDDMIELIRQGLLIRIDHPLATKKEELMSLSKEYPRVIASGTILYLLSKRSLIEVSPAHAWTAVAAILLSFGE